MRKLRVRRYACLQERVRHVDDVSKVLGACGRGEVVNARRTRREKIRQTPRRAPPRSPVALGAVHRNRPAVRGAQEARSLSLWPTIPLPSLHILLAHEEG